MEVAGGLLSRHGGSLYSNCGQSLGPGSAEVEVDVEIVRGGWRGGGVAGELNDLNWTKAKTTRDLELKLSASR